MSRAFIPKVITANDLMDGDVVYLTTAGDWTRDHDKAALARDASSSDKLLKLAESQGSQIVGAYAADARVNQSGAPMPAHFREAIRTVGPSNYFHGKQARG